MALSQTQLVHEVWRLLAEATDSPLGELVDGDGTVVSSGEDAVIASLYRGMCLLARTCLPIRGSTPFFVVNAGQREIFLADYSATHAPTNVSGYTPWACTDFYSLSRLSETREDILRAHDPDYQNSGGTTSRWYPSGEGVISLYAVPAVGSSVRMEALVLPLSPDAWDTADVCPFWLDDVSLFLLPRYTAVELAKVGGDDDRLLAKATLWWGEFEAERWRLYQRTPNDLRRFLTPPGVPTPPGVAEMRS